MAKGDLSTLTKTEAIDLAGRMRNKARNIKINAESRTERIITMLVGGGSAFVVGQWMGGLRHEKAQMTEEQVEADGDPTKLMGIGDKDLILGLAIAGVSLALPRKIGTWGEKMAQGVLFGWAYSRGEEMGVARAAEAA